ncbi:VOC family protein [uncultured Roseobacter sp.]|uniref:VOC family protein n=1 Tax=uncultured Roseobacter sp. TaxID=114847 RepID=UPI0026100907|nr:VOC family protein [uncultured Roseobacter sp.]
MSQSEIQCRVRTLDHLVLTVTSIPDAVRFYTQVLGMRGKQFEAADGSRRWALLFGQHKINLHQKGREFEPKAAHAHPGTADLCFLTDAPLDDWIAHLGVHQVSVMEGPVRRSGATGPISSLYIRDPDNNLIEISVPAD